MFFGLFGYSPFIIKIKLGLLVLEEAFERVALKEFSLSLKGISIFFQFLLIRAGVIDLFP